MCSSLVQLFAPNPSSIGRLLRTGYLFLVTGFALLVVSPIAHAVSPPPGGGYPNQNTAEGDNALFSLTTGTQNTATGFQALFSNTTGGLNTATGSGALQSNTTGSGNTANGFSALFNNTTGGTNTATGNLALLSNVKGSNNTATGDLALVSNFAGNFNTATGAAALELNVRGNNNTATGFFALAGNDEGSNNTATGVRALQFNSNGSNNTANGVRALSSNSNGSNNTANGFQALSSNSFDGSNNTAEGFRALANSTGSNNIAVGSNAGINLQTGNNNIYIGAPGLSVESDTIRIGQGGVQKAAYIRGISGVTVPSGVAVIVGSNGHLGTVQSSARYKDEIKPMDKASEAILALKPVTFRYKEELDPDRIPQFGLVAEEVDKVNRDLVIRGEDGKVMSVRYEAVNAMLLNEFLKEHRKVQEQQATIACLKNQFESKFAQQQKQIEALTATVRTVSERVMLSAPAPQTATNVD
jgi:hypothetical protein